MPLLEYCGLLFEWHDDKAELVLVKRSITLDEIASAFFDEFETTYEDNRNYEEVRFATIGMSHKARLLTIIWTQRGDIIRVITAFKSSKSQERRYKDDQ